MARTAATATTGRANRRFLLLALLAGLVSAILVYAALSRATEDNGGAATITVPAVVAARDIPARTEITAGMVEVKQVPVDDRSDLAFSDPTQVVGQVTRFPIAAGEHILSTKVVALTGAAAEDESLSFVVPPGMRGVAITVNQVIGSGGLVLPGDYVDVIAVFDVEFQTGGQDATSRETKEKFFASTVLQNVEVLAVAQTIVDAPPESTAADNPEEATTTSASSQRVRNTEADPNPEATTVTLGVTLDDAQKIFVAEENGVLRLAVRPFGDDEIEDVSYFTELELLPPDLPNPFQR
jgi:pilus assembly protein CpaB